MTRWMSKSLLAVGILLAGCDGRRENAGEQADANAGVVSGEDTLVSGPAETAGEAQDRAAESANAAIEANADAAEDRADAIRSSADREADALEERAKKVRRDAEQKADAAEDRADAIRGK